MACMDDWIAVGYANKNVACSYRQKGSIVFAVRLLGLLCFIVFDYFWD
jgi:hypothetical protein